MKNQTGSVNVFEMIVPQVCGSLSKSPNAGEAVRQELADRLSPKQSDAALPFPRADDPSARSTSSADNQPQKTPADPAG